MAGSGSNRNPAVPLRFTMQRAKGFEAIRVSRSMLCVPARGEASLLPMSLSIWNMILYGPGIAQLATSWRVCPQFCRLRGDRLCNDESGVSP